MKPEDAAKLHRRMLSADVPPDIVPLVAELLDHARQLEQAIDLIRGGVESALRHAPDFALHLVRRPADAITVDAIPRKKPRGKRP